MNHSWSGDAACKGMDPSLFYIGQHETVSEEVVFTCRMCPVREDCLDYALVHERDGYWGGTSAQTRKRLRRERHISLATPSWSDSFSCGTAAGYQRHRRRDEPACAACRHAKAARQSRDRVRSA